MSKLIFTFSLFFSFYFFSSFAKGFLLYTQEEVAIEEADCPLIIEVGDLSFSEAKQKVSLYEVVDNGEGQRNIIFYDEYGNIITSLKYEEDDSLDDFKRIFDLAHAMQKGIPLRVPDSQRESLAETS